jgi:uncharacterized repeat protein (TIGR01451 family)
MVILALLLVGPERVGAQDTGYKPLPVGNPTAAPPVWKWEPAKPAASTPVPPPSVSKPAERVPKTSGAPLALEVSGPAKLNVGLPLTYQIVVRNTSGGPLNNVRLEDVLPAGVQLVSTEPTASTQGNRLSWTLGTLEAGAERRFQVEVQPGRVKEVQACATVTYSAASCVRTTITQPKLALSKTGPDQVRLGDNAVFLLRVSNQGDGPATKVMLHDELPEALQHESGPSIDADIGTLGPGESKEVRLETKAVKPGRCLNRASVSAENVATVTAEASVLVTEAALQLRKSGPNSRYLGREAEFDLEVSNPGTAATTNVLVVDQLPDGLDFLEASDGGTWDAAARTVTWTLATVEPGGRRGLKIKVVGRRPGDYVNRATAQGERRLETTATAPLRVEGIPALALEVVDLDDPVEVGAETEYEIRIVNQGSCASTGLQIVATVPDGMTPRSGSGPAKYRIQGQQVIFEPLPKLAPKADTTFRVRVLCKQVGNWRFKVQMNCEQLQLPVYEEESTHTYKDR